MDIYEVLLIVIAAMVLAALVVAAVLIVRSHKSRGAAQRHESDLLQGTAEETARAASDARQTQGVTGDQLPAAAQAPAEGMAAANPEVAAEGAPTGGNAPASKSGQTIHPQSPAQATVTTPAPARPESSASRLTRLRARLARSANPFGRALFTILSKDHLSEDDWQDVEDTLLLADVGSKASEDLVARLRQDARISGSGDQGQIREALRVQLLQEVGMDADRRLNADKPGAQRPGVIIMVGVNGTGKTTTAGKLARLFVANGRHVVLGAADTFRAAAADQLQTWGAKVGVPVVRADRDGADPASVAFEAAKQAQAQHSDVLIIDTAGRLQNKANLMDELGKIRRVTEKTLPVEEVLLVLDATTGQNGLAQAAVFAQAIGITGVVLSKLDGSAKGGIVISVQRELDVPVKLVGLGEGPDDLAAFDPEAFVDGILG